MRWKKNMVLYNICFILQNNQDYFFYCFVFIDAYVWDNLEYIFPRGINII